MIFLNTKYYAVYVANVVFVHSFLYTIVMFLMGRKKNHTESYYTK